MSQEHLQPPVTTDELANLARLENWDRIDSIMGSVCDDEGFLQWSRENLTSDNKDERDLAASILEATSTDVNAKTKRALKRVMDSDPHVYAKFRSAFALFKHGDRSHEVLNVVHKALGDEDDDVVKIAQGYLDQL